MASCSNGSGSRYAFRDITNAQFSWALCRTHLLVKDKHDLQCYETSSFNPESSDNKENCHATFATRQETVVIHWCADCTELDEYCDVKLNQWKSLKYGKCYACHRSITIPYNAITGVTERRRYETAFQYLNDIDELYLTFPEFVEGLRRAGAGDL